MFIDAQQPPANEPPVGVVSDQVGQKRPNRNQNAVHRLKLRPGHHRRFKYKPYKDRNPWLIFSPRFLARERSVD